MPHGMGYPSRPYEPFQADADIAACKALIRQGSRSFYNASLLLPRAVRDPAYALYAFCRLADDAIDDAEQGTVHDALDRLRDRLDRAYAGRPVDRPSDRAFARVIAAHEIPRPLPEALLEGFAWDVEGRRYATLSELNGYGARVAGAVGAMMTVLMGARDADTVARATDLGCAMQLTNIARDVGEDARAGRIYLPLEWMEEAEIDVEAWLAQPTFDARLGDVIGRLLGAADALYARSGAGIARLPASCRPSIQAARTIYSEIGRAVERQGYDSVTRRAVVSRRRKVNLLGQALISARWSEDGLALPPLPETQFLVDAVVSAPVPERLASRRSVDEQIGWMVDLFARLERIERRGGRDEADMGGDAAPLSAPAGGD